MTGSIIQKSPLPMIVPGRGQANPEAAGAPGPKRPGNFQEMLTRASAPLGVRAAESSDNTPVGPVGKEAAATQEYTVRPGDTLSEVVAAAMRKQGIGFSRNELYNTVNRIAAANGLANPDRVFPGQKIRLPDMGKSATPIEPPPAQAARFPTVSPATADIEASVLQSPAHGRLSSRFGMRVHPVFGKEQHHDGIDISMPTGTPVQPIDAGRVTFAGEKGSYGLLVEIDHGNGLTSRYAHLDELLVSAGEEISRGRFLGLAGQSGLATGPHLHLEIRRGQQPVNPLTLLSREKIETGPDKNIA